MAGWKCLPVRGAISTICQERFAVTAFGREPRGMVGRPSCTPASRTRPCNSTVWRGALRGTRWRVVRDVCQRQRTPFPRQQVHFGRCAVSPCAARGADRNRTDEWRFCRPLPYHLATAPGTANLPPPLAVCNPNEGAL